MLFLICSLYYETHMFKLLDKVISKKKKKTYV